MKNESGLNMENLSEPALAAGENQYVLITHDETTLYANEGRNIIWMENKKKFIKPKSQGASVMISGFACSCHGFMKDDELNLKSYKTFLAGSHREGWFTNKDLIEQLQSIFPLVEKLHPGKAIVFGFDNSMTHHAKAPNGLDASLLTLKDNGSNMKPMRDTTFTLDDVVHHQRMVNNFGQPKGLNSILKERKKWRDGMLRTCNACKAKIFGTEARLLHYTDEHGDLIYAANAPIFTNLCCARYNDIFIISL